MRLLLLLLVLFVVGCSDSEAVAKDKYSASDKEAYKVIQIQGCPAILNHQVRILDSKDYINLCTHKDKVILAVNVASRCGFTYQYKALQKLFEEYKDKDFVILGFPSRDFMYQEYSDEGKVKEFCKTEYGVTFPLFATSSVKGSKANSFYKDLAKITGKSPSWNFTKYLISKDGEVSKPFSQKVEPNSEEIIQAIELLL